MSLTPLPTTKANHVKKNRSELPYSEIHQAKPRENVPRLRKQWGEKPTSQDVGEQQRLQELENMLSEAQSRTAIVEQEAYDKAYAAGEKAGLTLGEKRAEQYLESMENIVKYAERELEHLQQTSVHVIVELSESITKKVVGEIPQGVLNVLEKSIQHTFSQLDIQAKHRLMLVVHPQDLTMFQRMGDLPQDLRVTSDEAVEQGTCKLLSTHHDVLIDPQAMIHQAAKHIRQHFLKTYEHQTHVTT